jgi:hypothetical protein
MARIAATLPKEVRESLNFGNGETQVLQVIAADTRRNDTLFYSCNKPYCAEFKRGVLLEKHIYEAMIQRRYPLSLKAKYGNSLGGMLFVGEELEESLRKNHELRIMDTWQELTGINVAAVNTKDFARILISKALIDVKENRTKFTPYALCQLPLQLHALTTASDGYPQWFDEAWLKRMMERFFPICQ